jgi:hypothetical protein
MFRQSAGSGQHYLVMLRDGGVVDRSRGCFCITVEMLQ